MTNQKPKIGDYYINLPNAVDEDDIESTIWLYTLKLKSKDEYNILLKPITDTGTTDWHTGGKHFKTYFRKVDKEIVELLYV